MVVLHVLISIVLLTCYCGEGEARSATTMIPDSRSLRYLLSSAANFLSNTLHKRFHKNQQVVLYMETEIDENFLFNPLEILCTGSMLISGMVNGSDFEEMREFLGLRQTKINNQAMFQAMQEYLRNDAYNVSVISGRKVYLSTDIFTNGNFKLLDSFKSNAKTRFQSQIHDLSKYGEKTKQKEIQEFVRNKSNGFIGPLDRMKRDFNVMMTASTYIQDFWLYPLESTNDPLVLTCTIGKEEFKLRTNTRVISTWYEDKGDRFGILIPLKRAKMSVFFYVPKTEDLFKELDENMNYNYMTKMIRTMLDGNIVRMNVTFPLIKMSYSRNLTYDMFVKGVESIFAVDAIRYKNMTEDTNLVVSEIFQNSIIRLTEEGCHFASITDLAMKKVNSSLANENAMVLKDLVQKTTNAGISYRLKSGQNVDLLHKRLNNPLYKYKNVGRKKKSSKRPYVTTKTNPRTQISDTSKGQLSTACKKRKRKLKPKRRMSKKCKKVKKLRTARSRKSYKAIPAPPYFEPTSTLSLNSNTMHHNFLGEPQATGYYTPLTSAGTEVYETESSRKPEMNRKSIPAEETLLGYESKSNHRQNKALWPEVPPTKWGFFRPRFTWAGPRTSRKGYTFPQESISTVVIKNSFFFAIVSHNTARIFAYGKVSHCKP